MRGDPAMPAPLAPAVRGIGESAVEAALPTDDPQGPSGTLTARAGQERGAEVRSHIAAFSVAGGPGAPAASAGVPSPSLAAGAGEVLARQVMPQLTEAVIREPAPGRVSVELDPPELGRVEIRLDLGADALRVTVSADRAVTGDLLRRHADMLLAEFRGAGYTGVELEFAGNRPGGRGLPGGRAAADATPPGEVGGAAEAPERAGAARHSRTASPSGLDLRL